MRILLTNDDGIHAPGLDVLEGIARSLSDDVWIVAPESEQSGASRSLTLSEPLRLRQASEKRFAVSGTPTDCVLMALSKVLPGKPDLVLSGVNKGQNIAEDVTYSGTIAGAMEGCMLEVPSIALSQTYGMLPDSEISWDVAKTKGAEVVKKLCNMDLGPGVFLNVNFPDCTPEQVEGMSVTRQGRRDESIFKLDERRDGRGVPYFWFGFQRSLSNPPVGTDLWAVYNNRISVTPLHLNLTQTDAMDSVRTVLNKAE